MAYDTCPHDWNYQTWNHAKKKNQRVKKRPLWFGNIKVSVRIVSIKLAQDWWEQEIIITISNLFIYKRGYSPGIKSFRLCSALNPDSSMCMNCCDSPWLFAVWPSALQRIPSSVNRTLLPLFVIIIDLLPVYVCCVKISLALPVVSYFVPVGYERNIE